MGYGLSRKLQFGQSNITRGTEFARKVARHAPAGGGCVARADERDAGRLSRRLSSSMAMTGGGESMAARQAE